MTAGQIWSLVKGGLAALFGALGWWRIEKHGEERAERRHAEDERDEAREIAERRARPIETPEQRRESARRELDRRRSLRDASGRS